LDSELDKPMRDVSGFWLTWYYFGYSAVYGGMIALAQIGGALLLTFRRTALLGACLLFGIVSNIVLVDVFYDVDGSALAMAVVLWCCLAAILSDHKRELLRLFWTSRATPAASPVSRRRLAVAVRGTMVAFAFGVTYWAANVNNRSPTALDGRWEVVAATGEASSLPMRVYFERNRAHMAVFRYADRWETHHFEVDPTAHVLRIWTEWLDKGPQIFSGSYRLAGDVLELDGRFDPAAGPVHLSLRRVVPASDDPWDQPGQTAQRETEPAAADGRLASAGDGPSSGRCNPNYDPCVPIDSDVDCARGGGNGPSYVAGPVHVVGRDVYGLDDDGDGTGCER
ncbi:MAG TPA: hypothetical protein VFH27_07525, partial [Longimicrobiaceae bacterium]|nr:hypothetical protein [Longimicrobiaceae bacterium]